MSSEARLFVKIDRKLKERVDAVSDSTSLSHSKLVEFSLLAICEYFEQEQEITVPFQMVPRSHYRDLCGENSGLGEIMMRAER